MAASVDSLKLAEQELIKQYGTYGRRGYNCTRGGEGCLGLRLTPSQLRRLSESHVGFRHTDDARQKIATASRNRKHTAEARRKLSEFRQAYYAHMSVEERKERSKAIIAHSTSAEGRRRASDDLKARRFSDPRMDAMRGVKHSDAAKEKMRDARVKFFAKPENRQRNGGLRIDVVADIKALINSNSYTQCAIAKRYGVPQSMVSLIKLGQCWTNVPPSDLSAAVARYDDATYVPARVSEPMTNANR